MKFSVSHSAGESHKEYKELHLLIRRIEELSIQVHAYHNGG
jgi:hypothetical protein